MLVLFLWCVYIVLFFCIQCSSSFLRLHVNSLYYFDYKMNIFVNIKLCYEATVSYFFPIFSVFLLSLLSIFAFVKHYKSFVILIFK